LLSEVPKISKDLCWTTKDTLVEIIMENKGAMNFLFQKVIKKPKNTVVHLDEIGSFVWKNIDGIKTTAEIGKKLEEKFGKSVTPVHQRLDTFLKILCEYKFISIKNEL